MTTNKPGFAPTNLDARPENDYSDAEERDFDALSRDEVPVHSLRESDLPRIIAIDRKITGRDRTAYYEHKLAEAMKESGVRVSLVAEVDGRVVGFIMARVDFGEFGQAEPEAVIDTLGVDPASGHRHVGMALMSQLLTNLQSLRVESVRTEVDWSRFGLLSFLARCGFVPSPRLAFSRKVR